MHYVLKKDRLTREGADEFTRYVSLALHSLI